MVSIQRKNQESKNLCKQPLKELKSAINNSWNFPHWVNIWETRHTLKSNLTVKTKSSFNFYPIKNHKNTKSFVYEPLNSGDNCWRFANEIKISSNWIPLTLKQNKKVESKYKKTKMAESRINKGRRKKKEFYLQNMMRARDGWDIRSA